MKTERLLLVEWEGTYDETFRLHASIQCVMCKGTGQVVNRNREEFNVKLATWEKKDPFPGKYDEDWFHRRKNWEARYWKSKEFNQPPPEMEPCEACGGTGRGELLLQVKPIEGMV